MEPTEFPPNSEASKRGKVNDKNVERVTSGNVVRKRKSLRKQFADVFVGGNAKIAIQYAVMDILLPAAQDTVIETLQQGIEMLFKGDVRRRYRGSTPPQTGPYGNVAYNRISQPYGGSRLPSAQRAMSRLARARHNFDEIVLDDRSEAEDVIDRLFDLVSRYESATVADLYELVGLSATHTDHKWGWLDLQGAGVSRVRGGYLLDLPDPIPLD